MSSFGESRFSATYMRRHPISGSITNNLFLFFLGALTLGVGVIGILSFTTGNPLQVPGGATTQFFLTLSLLLSPYLAMLVLSFMYIGSGIWRRIVLLMGSVAVTGYGLFKVFYYWYLAPPPDAMKVIADFAVQQWLVVAASIVVAFSPGLLIGSGLDR